MNDFERVSNEVSGESNYETSCECAIEWLRGDKVATVTFPCSNKYNSRIRKLAAERPDDVKIRHENKDGSIVATIPVKYIKINPPVILSEEQREKKAEQMKAVRERRLHLPVNADAHHDD